MSIIETLARVTRRENVARQHVELLPVEQVILYVLRPGAVRRNGLYSSGSEIGIFEEVWNYGQGQGLPFSRTSFSAVRGMTQLMSERGFVELMLENSNGSNVWKLTGKGREILEQLDKKGTDFRSPISVKIPKEGIWQTV